MRDKGWRRRHPTPRPQIAIDCQRMGVDLVAGEVGRDDGAALNAVPRTQLWATDQLPQRVCECIAVASWYERAVPAGLDISADGLQVVALLNRFGTKYGDVGRLQRMRYQNG